MTETSSITGKPEWLSPSEAAEFLGMSVPWINQARQSGRPYGPPYHKLGGKILYLKDDLLQYLDRQKVTPEDL
jgi:hypothetical protein